MPESAVEFRAGDYFMTESDQDAAIGRMVARYSAAKKRHAALMGEASGMSEKLDNLAKHLRGLSFFTAFWNGKPDGYARDKKDLQVNPIPSTADVEKLINDLRSTAADCRMLRDQLIEAGVNLE